MITIGNEWDDYISGEFEKEYYITLREKLSEEYRTRTVYPAKENIFNALKFTPYSKVKVLLLGQDPYHGVGQAHGLAFSVQKGVAKPPSLLNIFQHRLRRCAPKPRMPNGLDNAGCDAAEHGFNGERGRGKLTQKFGLDNLYR